MDSKADPRGRWRLHRGGVVNIWQYRDEEFDLSGGRVIFKGTNGSGKSRTLELLLPLCLDGDLRNMGCKGFDTVSMSRLMLDDYSEGTVRLGYAWVELRRVLADGSEDFCTAGIGVKASASSRQISDSWRFVTPLRVNKDFALMEQDRPITASRLREHIGENAVVGAQEAFRQRIAEVVYGITGGNRYTDLLHLQRTLRNPDIGLKVLQGQLEQLLSDALPPVDPDVIARTATGLDNLEGVRRNVARLRQADAALQEFLAGYRDYARGVLTDRAARLEKAEKELRRTRGAKEKRTKERDGAGADHRRAKRARGAVIERLEQAQTDLDALKASPAYSALGDLEDKEATVASRRLHVEAALRTAADLRAAEEQSVSAIERAAALAARLGETTAASAAEAREALSAVGLRSALDAPPSLVPGLDRRESAAHVLLSAEPDARPEELRRVSAPAIDVTALQRTAEEAAESVHAAAQAAGERAPLLNGLHAEAERLAEAGGDVERLGERAAQAAEDAADAEQRARESRDRLAGLVRQWAGAVRDWRDEALPQDDRPDPSELPPVPDFDDVLAAPDSFREAHREARSALKPRMRDVQHAVIATEQRLAEATDERARIDSELSRLRESAEVGLRAPALSTAVRDSGAGAPFFRLVDFGPGLSDAERAGLEAALRASGLLNAWVRPDGGIDTEGDDTWAVPRAPVDGPSLADVLAPGHDDEAPDVVAPDVVGALLRSVPLLGDGDAAGPGSGAFAVGCDGRWNAGPLHGRHSKDRAERIGAGAREQARRGRIGELEQALAEVAGRETGVRESLEAAQALEQAWNLCLDSFPDISEVLSGHAEDRARRSAAQRAAAEAEAAEAAHARARARLGSERAGHRRSCGELGVADSGSVHAFGNSATGRGRQRPHWSASPPSSTGTTPRRCARSRPPRPTTSAPWPAGRRPRPTPNRRTGPTSRRTPGWRRCAPPWAGTPKRSASRCAR
ncbi:hypothetical protein [Allosalinactinospora lopnorensis]|uniref:hypothetical protein n=1 Tax=Allosalinactinospora lopnorensis TaxID=1352348 RepID=UPI000623D367|nr:hypothetical protein [Allosalinactinospora lopnorensis]